MLAGDSLKGQLDSPQGSYDKLLNNNIEAALLALPKQPSASSSIQQADGQLSLPQPQYKPSTEQFLQQLVSRHKWCRTSPTPMDKQNPAGYAEIYTLTGDNFPNQQEEERVREVKDTEKSAHRRHPVLKEKYLARQPWERSSPSDHLARSNILRAARGFAAHEDVQIVNPTPNLHR